MKPIKINESEKNEILGLHSSKILSEQTTQGKTIADLQKLLGVKADNFLGPQTLAAIKAKLGQPSGTSTPMVDGFTYEQMKAAGWTDELLAKTKYKSLIPTTTTTTTITPKTGELAKDETISKGKQEVQVGGSTSLAFGSKEPSFDSKVSDAVDSKNI